MTTVADVVGEVLARLGVGHAFGVVGSGNFHVTNALRRGGVPFVAARHETGAAMMADAFARTSGAVTVLSLHQGCGLTNALTGIAEAAKSRTPLLVLAADTAGAAVRSNFRIDQDAAVRAVGAVPERVHTAASAVDDVVRAYGTCVRQRRTVVLNLPLDVQAAAGTLPDPLPAVTPWGAPRADPASVAALAALLDGAERPVFIAGRGARNAGPAVAALAERCGALLATSAVANGLFAGDPWAVGISGGFATPLAAELIAGSDLVVAWGASLTMWTTRHGALIGPDATVVQVDDDPAALGAQRPVHLGVLGDVGATARDVLAAVAGGPGQRTDEVAKRIATEGRWNDMPLPDEADVRAGSTRGCCRRRSTTCCPPRARWPSTPATSWATRALISRCPTRPGSASPRRSSRSVWAWPRRSARRWPGPTGCRSPHSATVASSWGSPNWRRRSGWGSAC